MYRKSALPERCDKTEFLPHSASPEELRSRELKRLTRWIWEDIPLINQYLGGTLSAIDAALLTVAQVVDSRPILNLPYDDIAVVETSRENSRVVPLEREPFPIQAKVMEPLCLESVGLEQPLASDNTWDDDLNKFTAWIQERLPLLNALIGGALTSSKKRETSLENGRTEPFCRAVIECQLGVSSNDSLSRILAAVATGKTRTVIWIAEDPRPEHIAVVRWLNTDSKARFYLVRAEGKQGHEAAPFTLAAHPDQGDGNGAP